MLFFVFCFSPGAKMNEITSFTGCGNPRMLWGIFLVPYLRGPWITQFHEAAWVPSFYVLVWGYSHLLS